MAVALEFRVLGPLEASRNGEPLPLRSAVQRRLLAALLAGADQTVSVEVLADAVWDDRPPENAQKSLLVYLHRLRRTLGEQERIVREPAGYRILVTADDFDAKAFDALAAAAREARRDGRLAEAEAAFAKAARLWRGEPYEDAPAIGLISAEAHRLGEARTLARQERLEVRLDLGMHAASIGEFAALVRERPFQERLSALRMLALFRAGRQAEALQVYRECRKLLADELGIDPGPLLQRVHDAILRRDERLESVSTASIEGSWAPLEHLLTEAPAAGGAPAPAIPRELPAEATGFTGRDGELRELEAARLGDEPNGIPPAPVLVISGMAGVGKTATAVHWAHRTAGDYPDGQLFLNLRGFSGLPALRPIEALTAMLRSLGLSNAQIPADTDRAAARLRTETAGRRMLFLLDNAATAEQVIPLLPGSRGSLVIVTSRNRMGDLIARHGGFVLDQRPLKPGEAAELLKSQLRMPRSAEHPAIEALARGCGYLPLALRIAAANLTALPRLAIEGYAQRLADGDQLAALRVGDSPLTAMRATLDRSYGALPAEAGNAFRLLGIAPVRSFTTGAVAALTGTAAATAERVVDQLANAHMVVRAGNGSIQLHDLVRDYAEGLVGADDPERDEALERLFDWYFAMTDAACRSRYGASARLLDADDGPAGVPPMDEARALRWLDDQRDNLIAIARYGGDRGHGSIAWRIADILRLHTWSQGDRVGLLALGRAALRGARAADDPPGEAVAELVLSAAYLAARDYPAVIAHAERAIAVARRIGWNVAESSAHHSITLACRQIGRLRTALEHGGKALALNRAHGRLRAQSTNLDMLGVVHGALGDLPRELRMHTEALRIAEEIGDAGQQATALHCLVQTSIDLGRLESAESYLDQARKIEDELEAGELSTEAAESVSALCSARGDYGDALAYAEAMVRHGTSRDDRKRTADGLIALAVALNGLGRHREAVDAASRALREAGDDLAEPRIGALAERAAGAIALGETEAGEADAHRLLDLARADGYRIGEGTALNLMAEARLHGGSAKRAAALAADALGMLRAAGHHRGTCQSLRLLEAAAREAGEEGEADRYRRERERARAGAEEDTGSHLLAAQHRRAAGSGEDRVAQ